MHLPDYEGGSILNLMGSIIAARGGRAHRQAKILPARKLTAKNIILLVIDGMGYEYLMEHGTVLKEHCIGKLTSQFPSTTAACIPTFATGLSPAEHGLTGWFMHAREFGATIAPLPYMTRTGGALDPHGALFGLRPLTSAMRSHVHIVSPKDIIASPFNAAANGKAKVRTYTTLTGMFRQMRASCTRGQNYVYAYWPMLDAIGHQDGTGRMYRAHLHELERAIARWKLPKDTQLIVTADHGMMDTKNITWIEDHPALRDCLTMPLCGEPRAAYAYVHPHKAKEFERLAKKLPCKLFSSQKIIPWFGPGKRHPELVHRIGDYLLAMDEGHIICDRLLFGERRWHAGNHGGISSEEMFVPVCIFSSSK